MRMPQSDLWINGFPCKSKVTRCFPDSTYPLPQKYPGMFLTHINLSRGISRHFPLSLPSPIEVYRYFPPNLPFPAEASGHFPLNLPSPAEVSRHFSAVFEVESCNISLTTLHDTVHLGSDELQVVFSGLDLVSFVELDGILDDAVSIYTRLLVQTIPQDSRDVEQASLTCRQEDTKQTSSVTAMGSRIHFCR